MTKPIRCDITYTSSEHGLIRLPEMVAGILQAESSDSRKKHYFIGLSFPVPNLYAFENSAFFQNRIRGQGRLRSCRTQSSARP